MRRRHMPPFIQRADERGYDWLARRETPVLDAMLPRLSRAANHSRLWMGLAAILGVAGGRKGRAAAVRGLVAVGITSGIVNGPLKLVARRHRPAAASIPLVRRLPRLPFTSSFPSGHAASAAAFATAAGLELPAAAAPLGVLAAGVAVSRVYTGVHYPSDVLVGAALGAGAGLVTHRVAEARSRHAPPAASLPEQGRLNVGDGRALIVAVNPNAGAARDALLASLEESVPRATIVEAQDLAAGVRARSRADTQAIIAAGGDGTINALVPVALERGIPLGVIPLGTLNHLARDLGIDDVDAGIDALAKGHLAQIDVATIDGRPFLNTASFGAYSEFVDAREALEDRIGKWPAATAALYRMVRHNTPLPVEIDGRLMKIWAIFVGNGPYAPSGFVPVRRTSFDDGILDIRILGAEGSHPRIRPFLVQGARRLRSYSSFEAFSADRLDVRSLDGPLRLACDGETFDGSASFAIEISPKRLPVFIPRPDR